MTHPHGRTGCATLFLETNEEVGPIEILNEALRMVGVGTEEHYTLRAARRHAKSVQWSELMGLDETLAESALLKEII